MRAPIDQDWLTMLQATDFTRSLAEREEVHAAEIRAMLLEFLDVLDALDRLAASAESDATRSLTLLQRQMAAAFVAADVEFVAGVGAPFDPHIHKAVEVRPAPGIEPGLVIEIVKRGCRRRGELLRLAEVIVAQ